jgi:secreted trypsin-like serine protease
MRALLFTLLILLPLGAQAIIGGVTEVNRADHNLLIKTAPKSTCSATKIHAQFLLTAAHCVYEKNLDQIKVSSRSIEGKPYFEILEVQKIIIHPSFMSLTPSEALSYGASLVSSDVALVKVIPLGEFLRIIPSPVSYQEVLPGAQVKFFGFGCQESINETKPQLPFKQSAQTLSVGIEALGLDHQDYSSFYQEKAQSILEHNFMTYGKRFNKSYASICLGDSGGGVYLNGKLVGVNSNYTLNDINPDTGDSASGIAFLNLHTRLSTVKTWLFTQLKS